MHTCISLANAMKRPDLSLIVALYFEEECVEEYVKQVRAELDHRDVEYEIVFVDDGSEDKTVPLVLALAAEDQRIKLVQLGRNYGKEVAVTAGIEHASGEFMVMMDVDLQDPPNRIMDFYDKINAGDGHDLVFGIRDARKDSILNRMLSFVFWRVLNIMTGLKIPAGLSVMRIFNRHFAEEFLENRERIRFIEGLFVFVGMRQTTMAVEHQERFAGKSKFNARKKVKLAANAILAFSDRPLEMSTTFGLFMFGGSLAASAFYLGRKLFFGIGMTGWTSTTLFILFLGSVQLLLLGIIGMYVGRIYTEVKARKLYTVLRYANLPGAKSEAEAQAGL